MGDPMLIEETVSEARAELYTATEQQLFSLIAITARSKRALASGLDHRLPPSALPVLGLVLRTQRITQSEICEKLLIDKATLSRLVSKIEEIGLIVREVDQDDRRVSHLLPTELAIHRWREWMGNWRKDLRGRMNEWSDEDLSTLVGLLERLGTDIQAI